MNKSMFTYTNDTEMPRFWDKFDWELYIKIIKAKMKQDYIIQQYKQKLKNETK